MQPDSLSLLCPGANHRTLGTPRNPMMGRPKAGLSSPSTKAYAAARSTSQLEADRRDRHGRPETRFRRMDRFLFDGNLQKTNPLLRDSPPALAL